MKPMGRKNVFIIGAGQLGSRHLQALKFVQSPLSVVVIDPSADSLQTAKERYDSLQASNGQDHEVSYSQTIPSTGVDVAIAIVATNSNVRRKVIEELIAGNNIEYLILEKLLFQRKEDFADIEMLLAEHKVRAWVNCSMRTMPFYANLKEIVGGGSIDVTVTGSQYGLVTNAIHYLDYIAYLTSCNDFTLRTDQLLPTVIESKRPGFSELNGALYATFADGSSGHLRCFPSGNAPIQIAIFGEHFRCISRENEKRAWVARSESNWAWQDIEADVPYQSAMTTKVVESLIASGTCLLAPYQYSIKTHLILLEALQKFVVDTTKKSTTLYPFT